LAKRLYVSAVRAVRAPLRTTGILARLERSQSRRAMWFRSLFAIYDLDDMERVGLPWWTFDAIEAVERHLGRGPTMRVFEYGSGASTIWLSKRAAKVVSIEFDSDWHARLSRKLLNADNVELRLVPPSGSGTLASAKSGFEGQYFDDFVAAIESETEPFDVIVIDARAREACLKVATPHLAKTGMIVFDDTNRRRYRAAIDASELKHRHFNGMAVSLPYADSTTLLAWASQIIDGSTE